MRSLDLPSAPQKTCCLLDKMSIRENQPIRSPSGVVQTLVVVGNGPVGFAFLDKLTSFEEAVEWTIIVFGEESGPAYDRIRLSELFGASPDVPLDLASLQWYADRRIELIAGDPVTSIDLGRQLVMTSRGCCVHYDRLVLATGASPFVPPIPGIESEGVFVYRTRKDVEKIRSYGARATSAAVIGSGLLGLEAANALRQIGLETHIVEVASAIMPKQLDTEGAALLRVQMEQLGLTFHLLHRTQAIIRDGQKLVLNFDLYEPLSVDMILVATGIRPRDELAAGCGLKLSERGGVIVNDNLQTSDRRIFAIGECAVHRGIHYGLVAPGRQMADVLASNFVGHETSFTGSDFSTRLKLMGVDVCTLGDYLQSGANYDHLSWSGENGYRKIVLKSGRIVGAILVGQAAELSRLHQAILNHEPVSLWQKNRFRVQGRIWDRDVAEHISRWPGSAVVCNCAKVTKAQLTTAYENGCVSVSQLSACTRAGTVCGSCRPLLSDFVGDSSIERGRLSSTRLLICSISTLAFIAAWIVIGPIPAAQSVTSPLYDWQKLWNDFYYQQVTGFSAVGVLAAGMVLSLRKRWKRFQWGEFRDWRLAHGVLALFVVILVMVHTGLQFGRNFNGVLLATFLLVSASGSLVGIASSLSDSSPKSGVRLKTRSMMFGIHVALFWPLPVLLVFHVISAYYFGN
jgi:nitrite reductase (NADH) large subunit